MEISVQKNKAARTIRPLTCLYFLGLRLYVRISGQNNMATRTIRPLGIFISTIRLLPLLGNTTTTDAYHVSHWRCRPSAAYQMLRHRKNSRDERRRQHFVFRESLAKSNTLTNFKEKEKERERAYVRPLSGRSDKADDI